MTECLVNYAGGFVRRGLPGSLVFHISSLTGLQANHLVIAGSFLAFFILTGWFLFKTRSLFPPALVLSCIVLGIPAYGDSIPRKDCLCLLLLIACLATLKSRWPRGIVWLVVNIAACTAILSHEASVFFLLLPLVILHRDGDHFSFREMVRKGIFLIPAAACFALVALFHGTREIAHAINLSWFPLWRQIDPAVMNVEKPAATIQALGWSAAEGLGPGVNLLTSGCYQPSVWAALFLISSFLILWFAGRDENHDSEIADSLRARTASLLVCQFFFISPLFILGHDYGRWLFFWSASTLIFHACAWKPPELLETTIRRLLEKARILPAFRRFPAPDFCLLLFGIPVCWNIREFLIASPLGKHLDLLHLLLS